MEKAKVIYDSLYVNERVRVHITNIAVHHHVIGDAIRGQEFSSKLTGNFPKIEDADHSANR